MEFDFYKMYLEEMGNIPELGSEEEAVLLEGTARGERAARERLVEGSLGRVLALASHVRFGAGGQYGSDAGGRGV